MPIIYRIFTLILITLQPVPAFDAGFPYSVLRAFSRNVESWVAGPSMIPIVNNEILTPVSIPVTSTQLVQEDPEGDVILVRRIDEGLLTCRLYNFAGQPEAEFGMSWDQDIPLPVVLIEAADRRFFTWDIIGRLKCYGFDGQPVWERDLLPDPVFSYENSYFARLDKNRKELFLAISLPDRESQAVYDTHLLRLNMEGDLLEAEEIKGVKVLDILDTGNDRFAAVYRVGQSAGSVNRVETRILNRRFVTSLVLPAVYRKMQEAGPGQLILTEKNSITLVDLATASVVFTYRSVGAGAFIGDLAYDAVHGKIVLVSGQPEYVSGRLLLNHPRVEVLDLKGNRIEALDLDTIKLHPDAFRYKQDSRLELGGEKQLVEIDLSAILTGRPGK